MLQSNKKTATYSCTSQWQNIHFLHLGPNLSLAKLGEKEKSPKRAFEGKLGLWLVIWTQLQLNTIEHLSFEKNHHVPYQGPFWCLSPENSRWETVLLSTSTSGGGSPPSSSSITALPPGIVLGWSFLSHCCCNPVLFWLRRSGRRQEILVTLTAAAPFLLSSSNDVVSFGDMRSGTEPQWRSERRVTVYSAVGPGILLGSLLSSFLHCFSFRSSF